MDLHDKFVSLKASAAITPGIINHSSTVYNRLYFYRLCTLSTYDDYFPGGGDSDQRKGTRTRPCPWPAAAAGTRWRRSSSVAGPTRSTGTCPTIACCPSCCPRGLHKHHQAPSGPRRRDQLENRIQAWHLAPDARRHERPHSHR